MSENSTKTHCFLLLLPILNKVIKKTLLIAFLEASQKYIGHKPCQLVIRPIVLESVTRRSDD